MKKIVSFLLALVLTLSLTTNALAAVVSPKTDVTEAAVGQTVKLTVTASGQEPLTGVVCLNYRVYFDPAVFELDAAASAANTKGARLTALKTDEVGSYYAVSLLDPTSEGLDVSGDLYTLVFKVRDSAAVNTESVLIIAKAHIYTIADGAMQPVDNGAVENSTVTVKIISSAPATVTLGTAKAGANGIKVTWTQTEGAVKYNVYRRTADTKWTSAPLATVSGTSFTDKTVKAGETYIYTVRGIASDGKSLSTGYDKNGVTATALPATVKLTGAKASGSSIVVTWKQAEGAVKYRVYRQATGESSWTTLTSSATGTSYTDKKAKAGVTYTYTVRALNSANGLSGGYDKNGVKAIIAPATVTLGTAKAGANGITVTWQAADGAAKYNVYRKDAANTKWVIVATVSGTSHVDKTAKAGVKYTYTVRGVASDGKTLSGGYDKTGVTATALPATVKLTGAKVSGSSIVVTWSKAEGAVKYRVYRKSAGTDWTTLTSSATGTSYTDKTVKAGVKYTYTVRALNSVNGLSGGYDKNGVSAVIAPAKVVLVSARADSAGILVTWKAASGAHTYQVYRKTASDGWKLVAKNISDTEWKDTSAVKGTTYTYTVRAVADDGTTRGACDTRGKSAAVTKASTTPANVTMGKATAGKKGITVTWSYAADAKTYNVYRQVAGEKTWTAVAKNVNGKSWTDTKVTKGTKYTYMVRGVSANGKALSRDCTATVSATAK